MAGSRGARVYLDLWFAASKVIFKIPVIRYAKEGAVWLSVYLLKDYQESLRRIVPKSILFYIIEGNWRRLIRRLPQQGGRIDHNKFQDHGKALNVKGRFV
jgi:hypothetical protein